MSVLDHESRRPAAAPALLTEVRKRVAKMLIAGDRKGVGRAPEAADPVLIGRPGTPTGLPKADVRALITDGGTVKAALPTKAAVVDAIVNECQLYSKDIGLWARLAGVAAPLDRYFLAREVVELFRGAPTTVDNALVAFLNAQRADPTRPASVVAGLVPGRLTPATIRAVMLTLSLVAGLDRRDPDLLDLIVEEMYRHGQRVAFGRHRSARSGFRLPKDQSGHGGLSEVVGGWVLTVFLSVGRQLDYGSRRLRGLRGAAGPQGPGG